ncbi:hypothetical protein [Streptomyces sp. NPDC049881]|uniref:hypothetical protein n=1 Tax=unclassified Streptomyces TaxID=2593676 RepID=UPI003449F65F
MRLLARAATIAGSVALIAGGLSAGSASAASFCDHLQRGWGSACFESWGDLFKVRDGKADGYRVVAIWETDYGRSGECHNATGANPSNWVTCNYDMKETGSVRFRVCLRDGATGLNQSCEFWTQWWDIGAF